MNAANRHRRFAPKLWQGPGGSSQELDSDSAAAATLSLCFFDALWRSSCALTAKEWSQTLQWCFRAAMFATASARFAAAAPGNLRTRLTPEALLTVAAVAFLAAAAFLMCLERSLWCCVEGEAS